MSKHFMDLVNCFSFYRPVKSTICPSNDIHNILLLVCVHKFSHVERVSNHQPFGLPLKTTLIEGVVQDITFKINFSCHVPYHCYLSIPLLIVPLGYFSSKMQRVFSNNPVYARCCWYFCLGMGWLFISNFLTTRLTSFLVLGVLFFGQPLCSKILNVATPILFYPSVDLGVS